MKKVLSLQKLPFTSAEMLLNSGSSVHCGDVVTDPVVGNSNCSYHCTGAL